MPEAVRTHGNALIFSASWGKKAPVRHKYPRKGVEQRSDRLPLLLPRDNLSVPDSSWKLTA